MNAAVVDPPMPIAAGLTLLCHCVNHKLNPSGKYPAVMDAPVSVTLDHLYLQTGPSKNLWSILYDCNMNVSFICGAYNW